MQEPGGRERFDAQRRAWIARHQGWSTMQRRRAERLDRRIRARQRERADAAPDPHDDTSLPPWWLRSAQSTAGQLELTALAMMLLCLPLGLLTGYAIKALVIRLIPGTLRGYPIVTLLWAAAGLGAVTVLLGSATSPTGSPFVRDVVGGLWFCAQLVAAPAVAGVLGIAEGWLAVPASRRWFPLTSSRTPLSASQAAQILGGYDLVGPDAFDPPRRRMGE